MHVGLGNGPDASLAHAMASPGMENRCLTFRRYSLSAPCSLFFYFTQLILSQFRKLCYINTDTPGPLKGQQHRPGCSCGVLFFPPFICALSAATCSMREQATQATFITFYPRCHCSSSSLTQPPLFLSAQVQILISVLGDLPFLQTLFRCEVLFVLTYICYIIYMDYVVICVLAVGDNKLAVGDNNNALPGVAMGRHVQKVSENSCGWPNGVIRQSGSGLPVFGGLRVLINFIITIFIGIFVFYSLLQIE